MHLLSDVPRDLCSPRRGRDLQLISIGWNGEPGLLINLRASGKFVALGLGDAVLANLVQQCFVADL